jgi:uncharacterized membrane protein HdeD (DUF308 family)
MSTSILIHDVASIRHHWGWLLTLGIAMVVLGTIAIFITPAATLATVLILGWLLIFSGIAESIYAFRVRRWGGLFLHLIGGILGVLIGLLIITHPVAGALAWTLLFASFFTVIGLFRLTAAVSLKFPNWGWAVFDSLITIRARRVALVGVAVVERVVPGTVRRHLADFARMVLRHVCAGDPQDSGIRSAAACSVSGTVRID